MLLIVSPIVTEHPQAQNVTNLNGTIHLSCTVTGFPSPAITWFHNNTQEDNILSTTEAINDYTTRNTFIRSMAELNDSGEYFCKAVVDGYSDLDSNIAIVLVLGEYQFPLVVYIPCIHTSFLWHADNPEQPQNLTVLEIQSRSLILMWTEPHDNNAPIQGYFVSYIQPSFAGGAIVVDSVSNNLINVFGLFPGVTYIFTVIAYNEIGNSTESDSISIMTPEEGKS